MKPYSYTNNNNSVIINNTKLPKDWCNYLWSEQGYIGRFTQAGHGESYYIDKKANLCELNSREIRYIYLRNDDNNCCWNIGEAPLMEPVDHFECEHNIAYSNIKSGKDSVRASVKYFIPHKGFCEIWMIEIKNESELVKNLSVFSVVDFNLDGFTYPRYHEMFRTINAGYNDTINGIYCSSAHHYAPHNRYNGFITSSEKVFATDAHLKKFTGGTGSFARPNMLLSGADCTHSRRTCYDVGGVLQHILRLQPGETKYFHVIYGLASSLEEVVEINSRYASRQSVVKALEETSRFIFNKYSSISCTTPDERINQLMNNWVKKQVDFCLVGKKGVRDNAQVTSALLSYQPQKAREEILEIMRHQYKSGNAVLTWLPLDETRYSDQAFWIVWAVTELIKETGDYNVLNEVVEYQDGGEDTVLNHVKAGIKRLLDDRGTNGLVKIFFADWNDALNVLDDPEAESVMLTEQLCLVLKELAVLMNKLGEKTYCKFLKEQYNEVKTALNIKAFDGQWYARVLSSKGNIGSLHSNGSIIYLNAQVWAVLADVYDEDSKETILKAIDGMEHEFGFPINWPPYEIYNQHTGRMSLMAPGLFENGGVYCHASAFKVMMDGQLGRGDEALRTLKKIIPDSIHNPYSQSETEPYVFTNCYSTNPDAYGKADRSWITGTSAWCMKGLYEGVLGIYKDYDGLRIAPAIPGTWSRASAVRVFRGVTYIIEYQKSPDGKFTIEVEGKEISGNILPILKPGNTLNVMVYFV